MFEVKGLPMKDAARHKDDAISSEDCQGAIRVLIAKYGWSLPSEHELVEPVLQTMQGTPGGLEQAIKRQYMLTLYQACRQTTDLDRRKRAYADLGRYLYRAAYNRWPDIAEEVAHRALILTYERIDECKMPGAILTFALWQAKRAVQEIARLRRKEVSIEQMAEGGQDLAQLPIELPQFDQDCLRLLLDAIRRLPERQRLVIVHKYFDGVSDDVISQDTGLSVTNVRVLRNRGISSLRQNQQLRDACL
jgi:RNA polymerase sigma factor (sigma-70 family)